MRQLAHGISRETSGRSAATMPIPVLPGLNGRPLTDATALTCGSARTRLSKSWTNCSARLPRSSVFHLLRKVDLDEYPALRLEAAIDAQERREAPEEQACSDEQRERERHLSSDQHRPQALLARRPATPRSPSRERRREIAPRGVKRRHQAGQHAGEDGNGRREGENPSVDRDLVQAGHAPDVAGAQDVEAPV